MADQNGQILGGQEVVPARTLTVTLRRPTLGLLDERRDVLRRLNADANVAALARLALRRVEQATQREAA